MTIGVPHDEDSGSWRRGAAQYPETAASEVDEGGAMARSDLEPQDLAAIISVVEYAIVNFRYKDTAALALLSNLCESGCFLTSSNNAAVISSALAMC